jgi:hypothetical protein
VALSKDVVIRLLGDASSAVAAQKAAADAAEVSVATVQARRARDTRSSRPRRRRPTTPARRTLKKCRPAALVLGGAMLPAFGIA